MKAKELQIGDYVRISHRNKIGKVYRIDKANGEGNGYAAVIDGDYHEKDLEPIPLQRIHLIKNGFKVREYSDDTEYFYHDGYRINVDFNEGLPADNIPPTIYLSIDFAEKDIAMPIEYVHELQQAMRIMGCDKEIEL